LLFIDTFTAFIVASTRVHTRLLKNLNTRHAFATFADPTLMKIVATPSAVEKKTPPNKKEKKYPQNDPPVATTVAVAAVAADAAVAVAASAANAAAAAAAGTAAAVTDNVPRRGRAKSRGHEIWRSVVGDVSARHPRPTTALGRTHTRRVSAEDSARADLTRGTGAAPTPTPTNAREDDAMPRSRV